MTAIMMMMTDRTMIYRAFTWAKPFKDFNLMYFHYDFRRRFYYIYSAVKHPAQGSTATNKHLRTLF